MSCNSCNNDGNAAPPGGFTPSGTPPGSQSSYGGQTQLAAVNCQPQCPSPPTSSQVGRVPYCPAWVAALFGSYAGKMIIQVSGCLNYLRSGASGWIRYNGATETVQVDNAPPFASNVPRGTSFGYLALGVPTPVQVYNEALGTCATVGTQEIGCEVMGDRADGTLVISNSPIAGEVPVSQSADMENQVRFDRILPNAMESLPSVSNDIGFLVNYPGTRQASGQTIQTTLWGRLKKFILRRSQWTQTAKTAYAGTFQAMFVPVAGGDSTDPAFELVMSSSQPADPGSTLPAGNNQNDTIIYNGAQGVNNPNFQANAWVAYPRGLGFFPFASPVDIVVARTTAGSVTVTLPARPAVNSFGPIAILIYTKVTSSSATSFKAAIGTRSLCASGGISTPLYNETTIYWNPSPVTDQITIDFTKTGSGAVSCDVSVIGYHL